MALQLTKERCRPVQNSHRKLFVLITRKRYDRLFIVLFPLTLAIATALWLAIGFTRFFVMPMGVVIWFVALRFSIPPGGMKQVNATASPEGRLSLKTFGCIIASLLLMVGLLFWEFANRRQYGSSSG